jgi:hypothetical protein
MTREDIVRMAREVETVMTGHDFPHSEEFIEWCERFAARVAAAMPTLAVHVGYRYQSPVGGWEYGDHIPAGFDTTKWAHQKIYIIQEQS